MSRAARPGLVAGIVAACVATVAAPAAAREAGGVVGSAAPSPAVPCVPTLAVGDQTLSIDARGTLREVIVHLPPNTSGIRRPAVIAFHGYSSKSSELEVTSGLSELADEVGFVVAYPQALGTPASWHFGEHLGYDVGDLALTELLMTALAEDACIDPDRIVLAGHSMGGGMASDAACRLADRVAGVVLVSALWFELPCEPDRPVPVIAMHALDDPVLPYQGGGVADVDPSVPGTLPVEDAIAAWAARDGCGSPPAISTQADGSAVLAWPDCATPVVLHRLSSGGHDWPSVASDLIVGLVTAPVER